jgi:hypothetical protein
MDLDETLRILREAKGDLARISLASVDLLLAEHPDSEREKLRGALQVAAVPHWFDEKILGVLLDGPLAAEAPSLASQLRRLPVVEPFPARGPGAANVHEKSRLALRRWMKGKSPDRLAALSERAKIYCDGTLTRGNHHVLLLQGGHWSNDGPRRCRLPSRGTHRTK